MANDIDVVKRLIVKIRNALVKKTGFKLTEKLPFEYKAKVSQTYITLFQEGNDSIRWGSRKATFEESINRIIQQLRANKNFSSFLVADSSKCRIMFEIVTKETACDIKNLNTTKMDSANRFEPGITGFKFRYENKTRYFMPSDAYVKSIYNISQLLNYMSKQCGIAKRSNSIKKRGELMRSEPIDYTFVFSKSYISFNDEVLRLNRAYPEPIDFSKEIVYDKLIKSVDWLIENMNDDGSFLYFYDPEKDSVVDYLHPNMKDPLYNNILRHSGGTISLLRAYELSKNEIYLQKAKESINFLISTFKEHEYKGEYACFPFFNKKSKLGGAGIGLVAMMHYYNHTKDESFRTYLDGLVRHILSRVDESGEMIGYYIHPQFNEGKALINPSEEIKKELFSFYYPGEALLGLALYYHHIENIDEIIKKDLEEKSEKALDLLVDVRPIKYKHMFKTLPSDAWLMQAIEEWVKVDKLKKQSYIDFVFNDTQQMFNHMYTEDNIIPINKDYIGGFYYHYGDHVYHDASRCEGVVSAYYLAKYLDYEEKASWIMKNMMLSAKGLMKTFHDEKSNYCHKNPKKALHSFRFKLTRQWVRVDSVQHAACFFARLLPVFDGEFKKKNSLNKEHDYKILEEIDSAGYSTVYKVEELKSKKVYALKQLKQDRFVELIENEEKALSLINEISPLKFYKKLNYNGKSSFLFDYCSSKNLKQQVEQNGVFSEEKVEKFIYDILEVLQFIDKNGLLHLDLKPANILEYKGKFVLMDWGTSIFKTCVDSVHLKGNPIYIAPEYYKGKRDIKTELYSLGCSIYFLLFGKHIFGLRKRFDVSKKIFFHTYINEDLSAIKSAKIRYLLYRLLDKDPFTRAGFDEVKQILSGKIEEYIYIKNKIDIDIEDEYLLYEKMAKDGIAFAQDKYARYFLEKDLKKAIYWFEKAAQAGFPISQNKLAYIYFEEKFQVKDLDKSYYWFKKAEYFEHDMALYYLGIFHEKGLVVKSDKYLAIEYYKKSAKKGYKKAYEKLQTLGISL